MKIFSIILAIVLFGIFTFYLLFFKAKEVDRVKIAPQFSLTDYKGKVITDKVFQTQKYTIVSFFASWCSVCPVLHKQLEGIKTKKIGVSWGEKQIPTKITPFSNVIIDKDGTLGISFGLTGVPETFVINDKKQILKHYSGILNEKDIKFLHSLNSI